MTDYSDFSREELVEALNEFEEKYGKLRKKVEELDYEKKKAQADFQNYKKHEEERKSRWQKQAQESLAEELIEVMDNLERALASADEDSALVKGVKMVADQLYQTLQKKGLERIDAEGEEFDPRYHKAVETQEHEEHNQVLEQKRKGYRFEDKVLREAEVVVSKNGE
jgi:molecular chaperone GrpE